MNVEDYFLSYLPIEELGDFLDWAFGKDRKSLGWSGCFMDRWNEMHGDLLYLEGNHSYESTMPKMIEFWREHGTT